MCFLIKCYLKLEITRNLMLRFNGINLSDKQNLQKGHKKKTKIKTKNNQII